MVHKGEFPDDKGWKLGSSIYLLKKIRKIGITIDIIWQPGNQTAFGAKR